MTLIATSVKPMSDWLKQEQIKNMSRRTVTLRVGSEAVISNGQVLGKVFAGTASAAAFASNVGAGAMGAITVSGGAKAGVYKLVVVEPGAGAGTFSVEDPDGIFVGTGAVGSAFSAGGLAFTLADGDPDFSAGDGFNITVVKTSEKYQPAVETATDGSKAFAGVFVCGSDGKESFTAAADTDYTVIVFEQDGIVSAEGLKVDASYDSAAKLQAIYDAMEAKGIRVAENKNIGYPAI